MDFVPHVHDLFGSIIDAYLAVAGYGECAAGLATKEFPWANRQNEILNRENEIFQ